jgi:nicotinate-nucleotide--dimethylbenzimidazole phosphoribosyltransferase
MCSAAAILKALDETAFDPCPAGQVSAERAHKEALRRLGRTPLLGFGIRPRGGDRRGPRDRGDQG